MVSGFSTWMQIQFNGERIIFITTMTTGYPHEREWSQTSFSHHTQKLTKKDQRPRVRGKTCKTLRI